MAVVVIKIVIAFGEALVGTAVVLGGFTVIPAPEVSSAILGEITAIHVRPIARAVHVRPVSAHSVRSISAHTVRSTGTTTSARVSYESEVVLV